MQQCSRTDPSVEGMSALRLGLTPMSSNPYRNTSLTHVEHALVQVVTRSVSL